MANKLSIEKKTAVISMLCEGTSIRAIERIHWPRTSNFNVMRKPARPHGANGSLKKAHFSPVVETF